MITTETLYAEINERQLALLEMDEDYACDFVRQHLKIEGPHHALQNMLDAGWPTMPMLNVVALGFAIPLHRASEYLAQVITWAGVDGWPNMKTDITGPIKGQTLTGFIVDDLL